MKKYLIPLILVVMSLSLAACGGKKGMVKRLDAQDLLARGQQFFANKKYVDAMEDFKEVIFNYAGSQQSMEATYYLAECYLRTRDYESAINEYQQVLNNYSPCRYDDEARFKTAFCYYKESPHYSLDQTQTTVKARQALGMYFTYLQDSSLVADARKLKSEIENKLAHKEYDAAKLYYKAKRYASARMYLETIIKEFPQSYWAQESQKLLTQIPALPGGQPAFPDSLPPASQDSTAN